MFVLKCDEDFRRFVRRYSSSGENIKQLERKLSFDGGILLTFNDQEACRDESLEFITIHHPIMKAIKGYYDENKQQIHNTAQFRLRGNSKHVGEYLFFIYLLEKTALKKDLILIPILVNLKNNKKVHIADELCDWFLGEIVKSESVDDKNLANYDDELFEMAVKEAEEYLEMIREEEEDKLRRNNDTLINNQIESVKQATSIKIKKASSTIRKQIEQGKSEEDPYVKGLKTRIQNFKISMEDRILQLEQKRSISVGFNIVAGGVVKIEK